MITFSPVILSKRLVLTFSETRISKIHREGNPVPARNCATESNFVGSSHVWNQQSRKKSVGQSFQRVFGYLTTSLESAASMTYSNMYSSTVKRNNVRNGQNHSLAWRCNPANLWYSWLINGDAWHSMNPYLNRSSRLLIPMTLSNTRKPKGCCWKLLKTLWNSDPPFFSPRLTSQVRKSLQSNCLWHSFELGLDFLLGQLWRSVSWKRSKLVVYPVIQFFAP